MAGCSSITSAKFQFPASFFIVYTITVYFRKEKDVSQKKKKKERKKERETAGPNMLKVWASKERKLALMCPKPELSRRKRSDSNMLKT